MSLQEKIADDLKDAMKIGESVKVLTLRLVNSSLHNREIEKKGKGKEPSLTEEEVIEVLTREAKKRRESIEMYLKGNRKDLAKKEEEELKIISGYLPAQLSQEEIEKVVQGVILRTGAKEPKDFGRVMGEAMQELKGKAEGGAVGEIIKNKLG